MLSQETYIKYNDVDNVKNKIMEKYKLQTLIKECSSDYTNIR